jgi:putative ATP-binding cassette transporter
MTATTSGKTRISPTAVILILCLLLPFWAFSQADDQALIGKIETFVQQQMARGKIPGLAVVIVKGDRTVYFKGFGFADLQEREPITPNTLFELGSCSKAFTGLAILQLEEKGLLNLNDRVDQYIPWLKMKYRGKEVPVTIAQFLYQTSGVPTETIGNIPAASGDNALEETVRTLVGLELAHAPGERFIYATINYDVLGLIIQKVSGQSYEAYIKQNILIPLQLDHTHVGQKAAGAADLATGYKLCFGKPAVYDAPVFRGNNPAGYVISDAQDMARWLKIQMGTIEPTGMGQPLIRKSHVPDPDRSDSIYAAGWINLRQHGFINHSGTNPNFSSFVGFGTEKLGVAVLANSISDLTPAVGRRIFFILRGMEPKPPRGDSNLGYDAMATKAVLVLSPLILLALILLIITLIKIIRQKRRFSAKGFKKVLGFIAASLLLAILVYLLTILPSLIGFAIPLTAALVWTPFTFSYAVLAIFLTGLLYYLLYLLLLFFPKKR